MIHHLVDLAGLVFLLALQDFLLDEAGLAYYLLGAQEHLVAVTLLHRVVVGWLFGWLSLLVLDLFQVASVEMVVLVC